MHIFSFLFSPSTSPAADHSDAPAARAFAPLQTFRRGFKRRSLPIKVDKSAKMRALQTLTLLLLLHQVRRTNERTNERDGSKMGRFLSVFHIAGVGRKLERFNCGTKRKVVVCGCVCGAVGAPQGTHSPHPRRFKYCALIVAGCILQSAAARRQMTSE